MKHHQGCENAKRHQCKCGQCDGALHGWVGGIRLARGTDARRQQRRQEIELDWRKNFDQKRKVSNRENRAASTDSVRMDLVDWLASKLRWRIRVRSRDSASSGLGERSEGESFEVSLVDAPVVSELVRGTVASLDDIDRRSTVATREDLKDSGLSPGITDIAAVDYVEQFAKAITESTYRQLDSVFDGTNAEQAKRQLINHFWCDLFVALAQAVDEFNKELNKIPEYVKKLILKSTKQGERSLVTKFAVGFVVDRAWAALTKLPIFNVLPAADILRALRILAMLACPAPEDHQEVREDCIKPLGKEILSSETTDRLKAVLLKGWDAVLQQDPIAGTVAAVHP
jgi:hypothetical protein